MADASGAGVRFPFVNLEKAIGRAEALYKADPRGREMSVSAAFDVWGYSGKSSGGFQNIGALRMYGLLKSAPTNDNGRKLALTDEALRYFRDEREDVRQNLLQGFALRPRLIAALWNEWKTNPPADTVARSHLKAERSLSDQAARSLLAIYKENLAFSGIKGDAKVAEVEDGDGSGDSAETRLPITERRPVKPSASPPPLPPAGKGKTTLMDGERELTTGLLSKEASFRLIVTGEVGVKEIERLIRKLELDKEILAEASDGKPDAA